MAEPFDFGSSLVDRYDGEIAATDYEFGRFFKCKTPLDFCLVDSHAGD